VPPEFDSIQAAVAFCTARLAAVAVDEQPLSPVRHVFTHFELTMTPLRARCAGAAAGVMEDDRALWYNPREPARIGLPAPIAALLSQLTAASPPGTEHR
jgi:A/G-specific adenine glycosylase